MVSLDVTRNADGIGPRLGKLVEETVAGRKISKSEIQISIFTDVVHVRNAQPAGSVKSDANNAHIGVYDVHMLLL